jgi:signal recognition particle subunit SRP54
MFDALTERLTGVFDKLTGRGALSAADVEAAMREVRVALLEADVALPVVRSFIDKVKAETVGEAVIRSVTPGQMIVKIVYDHLVETLGGGGAPEGLRIDGEPPNVIMMAGLQGSGKTTTSAKLALRLRTVDKKRVLLASLDVRRPAAMEQLAVLAKAAQVDSLPIVPGEPPAQIAKRALNAAKLGGHDIVILDTAGRTTIDEEMMSEAAQIAQIAKPGETLLVADSLTGQDAVETAKRFHERLPLTGLVLTRADGDGRGGAALSMRAVTGLPIKFLGVSERIEGLEVFDASRVAGRILGRGDVVGLVEKATQNFEADQAEKMAKKLAKGQFDLDDLANQLNQVASMGGLKGVLGMLPGAAAAKKQMESANINEKQMARQVAVIRAMTPAEKKKPDILNASRRRRIATGAGVDVAEVNRVLKMHRGMADMVKKVGKGKMPAGLMGAMGGGFRNPQMMPGMKDMAAKLPPGLSGSGLPGLPGLPGTKKP